MDSKTTIKELKSAIARFIKDRDWEKYHSPKNLSMSIAIESAELMEMFQWLGIEESQKILKNKKKRQEVQDELADIAVYLIDFCNLFDIDLSTAILKKMQKNAKKYPVKLAKGRADKYTHYERGRGTISRSVSK